MINYKLKRNITIVGHSSDDVELRYGIWNPISHYISDEDKSGVLLKIITLLNTKTPKEICDELNVKRSKIESIIDYLLPLNVLQSENENIMDYYTSHIVPTLYPFEDNNREILIISDKYYEYLSEILLKCNHFKHINKFEKLDLLNKEKINQNYDKDSLSFESLKNNLLELKDKFVVLALGNFDPLLVKLVNRLCYELNSSLLVSFIDGPYIFVGPTIIPDKTSCWECLEERVTMNLRQMDSYLNYKNALSNSNVLIQSNEHLRIEENLLLAHTSLEITNFALAGANYTLNKVLSIYLPTMEIVYNEVLRLPSCKTCGSQKYISEKELLFSLQSLINH